MSQHPNSPPDPAYYSERAAEERRLAMASKDPKVRAIHLELAERYDILARSGGLEPPPEFSEDQTSA